MDRILITREKLEEFYDKIEEYNKRSSLKEKRGNKHERN